MKKTINIIAMIGICCIFTACASTSPSPSQPTSPSLPASPITSTSASTDNAGQLKLGYGISADASKSKPAEDGPGLTETDANFAAVTIDSSGRFVNVVIDALQAKIGFDKEGKLTTDTGSMPTKNQLGEAYGMKKASSIGKEWNEQVKAFADYCKGMTLEEVKAIKLNDKGAPEDAELASSCTISVKPYIEVLELAHKNAGEQS